MKTALFIVGILALMGFVFWIRVLPFREKKTREPERTAKAEVITRQVESGANRTGRSSGMGYNYRITFRLEDGTDISLYAPDHEYGTLREGMTGTLTWKGPYYVSFETDQKPEE